ncbi:MAG: ATP-grasp domain-containing protein, partial [Bacteroidota bacterium]
CIVSFASDMALPTVNYVASELGLVGNSMVTTLISTDKFEMRNALSKAEVPCPRFELFTAPTFQTNEDWQFPVIVKPTDRSGSRGVTKVTSAEGVDAAIRKALENSLAGRAIVEEFIVGREFSVEILSCRGTHYPLAVTDKVTTGPPFFVETEHHQPAEISEEVRSNIFAIAMNALDVLGIRSGASHTEVFLTATGDIRIVEVAGRMGGELIGSHMVPLSTGFDFVRAVLEVALGDFDRSNYVTDLSSLPAGVYYVLPPAGRITAIENHHAQWPDIHMAMPIMKEGDVIDEVIDGAGKRAGILVYSGATARPIAEPNEVLKFNVEDV